MADTAVFEPTGQGDLYDLKINGRHAEYDVEPDEFARVLRRRRFEGDVFIEDDSGYRVRWTRR